MKSFLLLANTLALCFVILTAGCSSESATKPAAPGKEMKPPEGKLTAPPLTTPAGSVPKKG